MSRSPYSKVKLGEIATFRHGGTPAKANAEFWSGDIPWVSPKDMHTFAVTDTADHISLNAVKASATSLVPAGTLLMVIRSGILVRKIPIAVAMRELSFNQDIKAILPDTTRVDTDYLELIIRGQESVILSDGVKKGGTVHSLKSGFIENLTIPLPPLSEQRRLAAHLRGQLTAVAEARAALQAQLKAVDRLPAALLREVFGPSH